MKVTLKNEELNNGVDFNFIIVNEHLDENDDVLFFGNDETIIFIEQEDRPVDMFDLLVFAQLFKSKGDAKRNWNKSGRRIPRGFTEFKDIGKMNKRLTILNPVGE